MSKKLSPENTQAIHNKVDNNSVVMFNLKTDDAFFMMTPEEARYAIKKVNERRNGTMPEFSTLKDNKWFLKTGRHKQDVIFYQQVANSYQIHIKDKNYYKECSQRRRGAVSSNVDPDSKPVVYDIALSPKDYSWDTIKKAFLQLFMEQTYNQLITMNGLICSLKRDGILEDDDSMYVGLKDLSGTLSEKIDQDEMQNGAQLMASPKEEDRWATIRAAMKK